MITSKQFRDKRTGEIVTQVPVLEIAHFEEVEGAPPRHYFATHALGFAKAETKEGAIEKLLLQNTDPQWARNCLKDGEPLGIFVCCVEEPIDTPYRVDSFWLHPKGVKWGHGENRMVTYLTKTKYTTMRNPNDRIRKLGA